MTDPTVSVHDTNKMNSESSPPRNEEANLPEGKKQMIATRPPQNIVPLFATRKVIQSQHPKFTVKDGSAEA